MAAIPYHVAKSFKAQKADNAGAFVSTGKELYSYALRLAHWEDGEIVLDVKRDYKRSATTSRHLRALYAIID